LILGRSSTRPNGRDRTLDQGAAMPGKGYWMVQVDVSDVDGYKLYVAENAKAFRKYGGRFLARGGKAETVEGTGRSRCVVLEFPDYASALACYRSPEYARAIELRKGKGGQMVRSAGTAAQLMAKSDDYAQVRMPSGEVRRVHIDCMATLGQVGNVDHENIEIGKAGRSRYLGRRPTVRGSVMNPRDHPHGGGEGKAPIGGQPKTKWGKPAFQRTRNNKRTDSMIVRRRPANRGRSR